MPVPVEGFGAVRHAAALCAGARCARPAQVEQEAISHDAGHGYGVADGDLEQEVLLR